MLQQPLPYLELKRMKIAVEFMQAKDVKLWALEARRNLVLTLLDCWVEKCQEDATVEVISLKCFLCNLFHLFKVLLTALSHPNFKDMKLRVEKMINMS